MKVYVLIAYRYEYNDFYNEFIKKDEIIGVYECKEDCEEASKEYLASQDNHEEEVEVSIKETEFIKSNITYYYY